MNTLRAGIGSKPNITAFMATYSPPAAGRPPRKSTPYQKQLLSELWRLQRLVKDGATAATMTDEERERWQLLLGASMFDEEEGEPTTALLLALKSGDWRFCHFVISEDQLYPCGWDASLEDAKCPDGKGILHYLIFQNRSDLVTLVLHAEHAQNVQAANLEQKDEPATRLGDMMATLCRNESPFMYAFRLEHHDCVSALLRHRAQMCAFPQFHVVADRTLQHYTEVFDAFARTAKNGDVAMTKTMIAADPRLCEWMQQHIKLMLKWASMGDHVPYLDFLFALGHVDAMQSLAAPVNQTGAQDPTYTELHDLLSMCIVNEKQLALKYLAGKCTDEQLGRAWLQQSHHSVYELAMSVQNYEALNTLLVQHAPQLEASANAPETTVCGRNLLQVAVHSRCPQVLELYFQVYPTVCCLDCCGPRDTSLLSSAFAIEDASTFACVLKHGCLAHPDAGMTTSTLEKLTATLCDRLENTGDNGYLQVLTMLSTLLEKDTSKTPWLADVVSCRRQSLYRHPLAYAMLCMICVRQDPDNYTTRNNCQQAGIDRYTRSIYRYLFRVHRDGRVYWKRLGQHGHHGGLLDMAQKVIEIQNLS
jgi:hypothetical protein